MVIFIYDENSILYYCFALYINCSNLPNCDIPEIVQMGVSSAEGKSLIQSLNVTSIGKKVRKF